MQIDTILADSGLEEVLARGLQNIQKAFNLLLTWMDWICCDYFSPSLFFFSQPWLIRHHLGEFQAMRKAEEIVCGFIYLFLIKEIKISWFYNSLTIGPDARTWASVLFSLRTELLCCFGCGWEANGVPSMWSSDLWLCPEALNAEGAAANTLGLAAPAMAGITLLRHAVGQCKNKALPRR